MSVIDQPNSPRHAHLKAQWKQGQKWETLVEGASQWTPVGDGGYAEPTWDHRQEYRQVADAAAADVAFDRKEIEAVIACLGDDAAQLRQDNDEDERAANMDQAATMLNWLMLTHPAYDGAAYVIGEDGTRHPWRPGEPMPVLTVHHHVADIPSTPAPRDDVYRVWRHQCPKSEADEVALPIGDRCAACGATGGQHDS